jgi:hypothetical protein
VWGVKNEPVSVGNLALRTRPRDANRAEQKKSGARVSAAPRENPSEPV